MMMSVGFHWRHKKFSFEDIAQGAWGHKWGPPVTGLGMKSPISRSSLQIMITDFD